MVERLGAWLLGAIAISRAGRACRRAARAQRTIRRSRVCAAVAHSLVGDGLTAPFIHPLVLENRLARPVSRGPIDRDSSALVRSRPARRRPDARRTAAVARRRRDRPRRVLAPCVWRAVVAGRDPVRRARRAAIGALSLAASPAPWAAGSIARSCSSPISCSRCPARIWCSCCAASCAPVLETAGGLRPDRRALCVRGLAARGARRPRDRLSERRRDYAEAARAAGAGPWRLARHLLPAARGFLAVEVVLLVPALLVAEATISYLGLGFVGDRQLGHDDAGCGEQPRPRRCAVDARAGRRRLRRRAGGPVARDESGTDAGLAAAAAIVLIPAVCRSPQGW